VPNKHSCRQAYVLASILTGIVQLVTLLVSPLVGLVSASPLLSRNSRNPQAVLLAVSFSIGTLSSAGFALLPSGDPRSHLVWIYALGLGVAQAAGTVVSLALVTKGRGAIVATEGKEVGGSLSSAYSFTGGKLVHCHPFDPPARLINLLACRPGLGILSVGSTAGLLFDRWSSAPFSLLACVNLLVAIASLSAWFTSNPEE
jgi:hypothetical protein